MTVAEICICTAIGLFSLLSANGNPVYGGFRSAILANSSFPLQNVDSYRTFAVILPFSYSSSPARRYPVVYFLHGSYNDFSPYVAQANLILQGQFFGVFPEVLFVFPNGTVPVFPSAMWSNSALNGNMSDYVVKEMVSYIDANYRTLTDAPNRIVAGNSAGGYGAMSMALRHPEVFGVAIGLSGPWDWRVLIANITQRVMAARSAAGNGNSPVFNISDGIYTAYVYQAAAAFSPDLSKPNWLFVDYPLELNGTVVQAVQDRWQPYAITQMIADSPYKDCMRLQRFYFDDGNQDEYYFQLTWQPLNQSFAAVGGVSYTGVMFDGGHAEKIADQVSNSMVWLKGVLASSRPAYCCPVPPGGCPMPTTGTTGHGPMATSDDPPRSSAARSTVSIGSGWLIAGMLALLFFHY
eukprot:TRINITY_DN11479_c0_g1_i1.p1 TRINITY_DN11479_c0_g1~~TRINITY_DN11479_c0_g1_i1.p1  ORF type:complete len:408 (+),score=83.82 TRINITY_DN11479_c0_g1_i1:109-1332(+)